MAPLTIEQIKACKAKKNTQSTPSLQEPVAETPLRGGRQEVMAEQEDETSEVHADMSRGKRPCVEEEKEVEVLDAAHVAPSSAIVVNEWRSILRSTTGEGEICPIWDRRFSFPKEIDNVLVAKVDEEKVRSLGLAGTCRAVQAYSGWSIALARSIETQFRQVAKEMMLAERVASGQERIVELETALKTTEAHAAAGEILKLEQKLSRAEVALVRAEV